MARWPDCRVCGRADRPSARVPDSVGPRFKMRGASARSQRAAAIVACLLAAGCVTHPSAPLPTSLDFPECVAYPYTWSSVIVYDDRTQVSTQERCISERDSNAWDRCQSELKAFRDAWRRIEDARR